MSEGALRTLQQKQPRVWVIFLKSQFLWIVSGYQETNGLSKQTNDKYSTLQTFLSPEGAQKFSNMLVK